MLPGGAHCRACGCKACLFCVNNPVLKRILTSEDVYFTACIITRSSVCCQGRTERVSSLGAARVSMQWHDGSYGSESDQPLQPVNEGKKPFIYLFVYLSPFHGCTECAEESLAQCDCK